MASYVDELKHFGRKRWCHLIADTEKELHRMAERIGCHRDWYQPAPPSSHPHYDLSPARRQRAVELGVVACDRAQYVGHMRRIRELGKRWYGESA